MNISDLINISVKDLKITFFNLILKVLISHHLYNLYRLYYHRRYYFKLYFFNDIVDLILFFNIEINDFLVFLIKKVVLNIFKFIKELKSLFLTSFTSFLTFFLRYTDFYKIIFLNVKTL